MTEGVRPWRRALLWLALLGPFFFLSYGFANAMAARLPFVPSIVFDWEARIPFQAWTIVPYWSIDLFYVASFFICTQRAELDAHARRLLTAQLLSVACFLLWPLRFSLERPETGGVFGWLFDVLLGFDKPFNQAPSLHIVLLVVLWVRFQQHLHGLWRTALHIWFALIGLSVLTTWQHHFIDVPTGVAVGWLCVWLWPLQEPSPLRHWQWAREATRWRLGALYLAGSAGCAALAWAVGGWALWLAWPALSLLLVALAYAGLGTAVFQKQEDGRLSMAATWLLAPYLGAAWLNARWWTRRAPQPQLVIDGVWLGRLPDADVTLTVATVVDVCAELPFRAAVRHYRSVPMLDLATPSPAALRQAADAIAHGRRRGEVLVCCALGYSRSAAAVATWLCRSGHTASADAAITLLAQDCPRIVLHARHRRAIEQAVREGAAANGQTQVSA
jgi:membrane-associated phospholipid phosphatase